jgi:hypothetical protein
MGVFLVGSQQLLVIKLIGKCLNRHLTFDRCPVHLASKTVVVIKRSMQANTVVPYSHGIRFPTKPATKNLLGNMANDPF